MSGGCWSFFFLVDFGGEEVMLHCGRIPGDEEEVRLSADVAVEVSVGGEETRVSGESGPRFADIPNTHMGLGR